MPWAKQITWPMPAGLGEAWEIVPVLFDPLAVAYGFRLVYPGALPPNWQRAGFWCWVQEAEGQILHSETHPIPILQIAGNQAITVIGRNQSDTVPVGPNVFAVAVSINNWVPRIAVEIWVLT